MAEQTQSGTPALRAVGPTGIDCGGTPRDQSGEFKLERGSCLAAIGGTPAGSLRLPESGNTLSPWVAITFEGTGSVITVGNESSPNTEPKNIACISGFEFGYSDGLTCRCTIHDEEGGSFVIFMQHLLKDYICLKNGNPAAVRMKVQFGWIKSGCATPIPLSSSRCFYCLCDSVETNYHEGKFIFEITGKDLCHRMFEGGCSTAYGADGGTEAVPITQAIRQFMTQGCPPNVGSVRFCRMIAGTCQPCPFRMPGNPNSAEKIAGPKGKWDCKGFSKLDVVMDWLKQYPTDANKGWVPQYNSLERDGELIFWEDPKPTKPETDSYWDANCIGTYIVNGGKRSPVIEFNPKIRWDFARLTNNGGNMGDMRVNATGQPGSRLPGMTQFGLDARGFACVGQRTQATMTENHRNDGTGTPGVVAGLNAQHRAMKILHDNIEAELVVVGDPTILPPSEAMMSKNVTIIVVNPYYLRGNQETVSGLDWLANPTCNEVLSSKAWICKSITHRIVSGKYTTSIGVFLTAPGIDAPPDSPLGNWTNGWTPSPQC